MLKPSMTRITEFPWMSRHSARVPDVVHDVLHDSGRARSSKRAHLAGYVLICALLTACANPVLRQARQDCDPESHQLFPVVMQSHRVTEPVVVQVPDGTQHCITESVRQGDRTTAVTRCVPNYMMQTRWMDRWVQIDLNARERNIWHERCVQQLCIQRAGNTSCEPPPVVTTPLPPSPPPSPSTPAR